MSLFATMDAMLRDRESLYQRVAEGRELGGLCGRLLLVFIVAAAVYGAAMGAFRMLHPEFFFSDFLLTQADGARLYGRVIGVDVEKRAVFVDKEFADFSGGEAVFNLTRPTAPHKLIGGKWEKDYGALALAPDQPLAESGAWRMSLLAALKTPALFLLAMVVCLPALYVLNLAFRFRMRFMQTTALIMFALAATAAMLAVFAPIAALFAAVTENYHFMKNLHVIIFAISGFFGARALAEGARQVSATGAGMAGWLRVKTMLAAWLLLYCFVGGQIAWTLKPWLGTPYLPATPPFRVESGNIYINFFQSAERLGRKPQWERRQNFDELMRDVNPKGDPR